MVRSLLPKVVVTRFCLLVVLAPAARGSVGVALQSSLRLGVAVLRVLLLLRSPIGRVTAKVCGVPRVPRMGEVPKCFGVTLPMIGGLFLSIAPV